MIKLQVYGLNDDVNWIKYFDEPYQCRRIRKLLYHWDCEWRYTRQLLATCSL